MSRIRLVNDVSVRIDWHIEMTIRARSKAASSVVLSRFTVGYRSRDASGQPIPCSEPSGQGPGASLHLVSFTVSISVLHQAFRVAAAAARPGWVVRPTGWRPAGSVDWSDWRRSDPRVPFRAAAAAARPGRAVRPTGWRPAGRSAAVVEAACQAVASCGQVKRRRRLAEAGQSAAVELSCQGASCGPVASCSRVKRRRRCCGHVERRRRAAEAGLSAAVEAACHAVASCGQVASGKRVNPLCG